MMKLGLSSDYGAIDTWKKLIAFGKQQGGSRLVYWGDSDAEGSFGMPFLFPRTPGLVPDEKLPKIRRLREQLQVNSRLTRDAGMEFWTVFQILQLPSLERARSVLPDLFNAHGEPDMAGERIDELIRGQLDEILELAPSLCGIELWIMECAAVKISQLRHQRLSLPEIFRKLHDVVYDVARRRGLLLAQDLHTAGGDPVARTALAEAAARHPDVLLSGDNTIGDFHLRLPFNPALVQAARTNPIQAHFDLLGEYWGRNFVPTTSIHQLAEHIEKARELKCVYLDGRVNTGHDRWSPYANVLPSRRGQYPLLQGVGPKDAPPPGLQLLSFDTLGGFNAEFFYRRAADPAVTPETVIRGFLRREFPARSAIRRGRIAGGGEPAERLTPVFLRLQATLEKIYYTAGLYYGAQSVFPVEKLIRWAALEHAFAAEPGSAFPPPEILPECDGTTRVALGSLLPAGFRVPGLAAMIREKEEAVREAEAMMAEVEAAEPLLSADDFAFLRGRFADLVWTARAFRFLLEAQAHVWLQRLGVSRAGLPDAKRFADCARKLVGLAAEWEARYHPAWHGNPVASIREFIAASAGANN
ncbi:MAG: hypothetical protein HY343_12885 [Lentisphaerae bacterium]|nr:hypothetical protein [Lentisphaerota bacterium]